MSGLANIVVIVAVVALVIVRQVRPRRVKDGRSLWILPAVLLYLALREHGIVDAHHEAVSVGLLAGELLIGVGMGVVWAFTSRIWRDQDGVVWTKGTKATAAAWAGGIALRIGLAAVGAMMGVHQGEGATMLALAGTLLIRTGLVVWRARELEPVGFGATAAP
ncbi:DUF1453 domain-containing protein [Streptantibioticus parmotrematis]|uniref:DUF1453 domain-containing protein n=1 Tax=Streptantibioticus parmotrematis TaxID=2873249 RepID=UPI0033FC7C14